MKKLLILFVVTFTFTSCASIVPLKGSYQQGYEFTTELPKEQVWRNLIDFFTKRGIGIKIIDKQSGLLITDRYKYDYTTEDNLGNLVNPDAPLVRETYKIGLRVISSYDITAEFNVVINDLTDNKTEIKVNIVNPRAILSVPQGMGHLPRLVEVNAKSTGVLEKLIFDQLTKK